MRFRCTALTLMLAAWCAAPGHASGAAIDQVQVGIGGKVKLGHWTRVVVRFKDKVAGNETLVAKTTDGGGTEAVYRLPITSQSMTFHVKWGRTESDLVVQVLSKDEAVLETRIVGPTAPPLPSTSRLILSAGNNPKLAGAISLASAEDGWTGTHVAPGELPDKWYGYDAVETLLLTTSDPQTFNSISPAQFRALELWVRLGGRLILTVGAQGNTVFSETSPFRAFLAGDFQGVVQQTRTEKIEIFVGAKSRLDRVLSTGAEFQFPVCSLANLHADVELYESAGLAGDRPLITRTSYGLGRVVIVGFDLDASLFSRWEAYDRLGYQILSLTLTSGSEDVAQGGRVTHVGYEDLVGQLRGALDQFPGVSTVAFSVVAFLIVAYVLLIGPIDYLVLRKLGWQRMTWVTLPVVTIAFCVLAVSLNSSSKIADSRVNQVDLVDFDTQTGTLRGTTWSHVYSGRGNRFRLNLKLTTPLVPDAPQSLLSWHAMPGGGLGGLGNPSFSPGGQPTYQLAEGEGEYQIRDVPVHVSGTRSFVGRWWGSRRQDLSGVKLTEQRDGLLAGQFRWDVPVTLESSVLVYKNWAYYIRFPLKPGTQVFMRELPSPKHFDWRLTRKHTVNARNVTTPWDSSDLSDVDRIMELMMFFKLAGGRNYTGLSHRYQSFVDFSDLLDRRQAIIIGNAKGRATELTGNVTSDDKRISSDNYDGSWTFYRIIFPVKQP